MMQLSDIRLQLQLQLLCLYSEKFHLCAILVLSSDDMVGKEQVPFEHMILVLRPLMTVVAVLR